MTANIREKIAITCSRIDFLTLLKLPAVIVHYHYLSILFNSALDLRLLAKHNFYILKTHGFLASLIFFLSIERRGRKIQRRFIKLDKEEKIRLKKISMKLLVNLISKMHHFIMILVIKNPNCEFANFFAFFSHSNEIV